ncbi:hypothetical protein CKO09_04045 [Chromatium weissei]|nr:hypothetical protein [Chromatium weissei]
MNQHLVIQAVVAGALTFSTALFAADPAAGKAAWNAEHAQTDGSPARSCVTCHGQNLTQAGRHVKTGKAIEPMAPSVNAQRLTDSEKIEKWLLRNCKWTIGRECDANEKADFISYIKTQ